MWTWPVCLRYIIFRVVVSFGVARITFHVYIDEYDALTRIEYARNFFSCDFWHTFSFLPTLFHSFTSWFPSKVSLGMDLRAWEERKFLSSPANAKITKEGLQLHFRWAHAHPGNRLSNLKILTMYLFPFLTGLFLLPETTFSLARNLT